MKEKQWSSWLENIKKFYPHAKYWPMPTTTQEAFALMQQLGQELETLSKEVQYWHQCADSDALTGLTNRRGLMKELDRQLTSFVSPIVVLFIDVNKFKQLNDKYGHAVGDNVLCRLADNLAEQFPGCTIARLGGDEFVIVSQGKSCEEINQRITQLKKHLATCPTMTIGEQKIHTSISVGMSIRKQLFPPAENGVYAHAMLEEADLAMYEDKRLS